MGLRTPPRFVTRTMATVFTTVVRFDNAAARAARKSALVAFTRP
jgi:hypothetical protein